MKNEYIIGVDGGGTKTDYLLFTSEGEWVDSFRVGSRSHEVLPGGFEEVEELVLTDLNHLFHKNNISVANIAAAAFGMAGIDTPAQLSVIKQIINKVSLRKYVIANDSILGIKAGCPSGVGICSINGTGTVASGINSKGEILQVGGIGMATGDHAGGYIIASLTVRAVYDSYFRCGERTILSERLMNLYALEDPSELMNAISEKFYNNREQDKEIISILMQSANEGDKVAQELVKEVARELAKSVSGCIERLNFTQTPEVVLAGSIWTKTNSPLLLEHFKDCVCQLTNQYIDPIPLQVIPAAGAIIWAMELAFDKPLSVMQREKILNHPAIQNL